MFSKTTFAIGSGKGGVGKSTIAVNLAVALAQRGYNVGLLDADIYGPSIPIMTGLRRLSPQVITMPEGQRKILPFSKFGIKIMSIGFFMEESRSAVWRGPVMDTLLNRFLTEIDWGHLDILMVDLPPGTGDILISISQKLNVNGGLIVTTPQEVAMLDAIKALNAFEQLGIPTLGIIENMAGFHVPETGNTYPVFGKGKAQELARRFQLPLLASIPLLPSICVGGDEGYPAAYHQGLGNGGRHFQLLADNFIAAYVTR